MIDWIMPAKGKLEMTERAIKSILNTTPAARVILRIEEGDEELAGIHRLLPKGKVHIVTLPKPSGFSEAINSTLPYTGGPLVGIINNDVIARDNLHAAMLGHFDDPEVGIVGARLLYPPTHGSHGAIERIQHAGYTFDGRRMIDPARGQDGSQFAYCQCVDAVQFACVLVRRDLLVLPLATPNGPMTGLDEETGWGGHEDIDFSVRVQYNGYRVVCCADVDAVHEESATRKEFTRVEQAEVDQKNQAYLLKMGKRWYDFFKEKRAP